MGRKSPHKKMEHTLPIILQWEESFDICLDTGAPVDDKDYQCPFAFSGKFNKVILNIESAEADPGGRKTAQASKCRRS